MRVASIGNTLLNSRYTYVPTPPTLVPVHVHCYMNSARTDLTSTHTTDRIRFCASATFNPVVTHPRGFASLFIIVSMTLRLVPTVFFLHVLYSTHKGSSHLPARVPACSTTSTVAVLIPARVPRLVNCIHVPLLLPARVPACSTTLTVAVLIPARVPRLVNCIHVRPSLTRAGSPPLQRHPRSPFSYPRGFTACKTTSPHVIKF